jgi:hypothetical protein
MSIPFCVRIPVWSEQAVSVKPNILTAYRFLTRKCILLVMVRHCGSGQKTLGYIGHSEPNEKTASVV